MNWFNRLKCNHYYENIGYQYGVNRLGLNIKRIVYRCRYCGCQMTEDIVLNGW